MSSHIRFPPPFGCRFRPVGPVGSNYGHRVFRTNRAPSTCSSRSRRTQSRPPFSTAGSLPRWMRWRTAGRVTPRSSATSADESQSVVDVRSAVCWLGLGTGVRRTGRSPLRATICLGLDLGAVQGRQLAVPGHTRGQLALADQLGHVARASGRPAGVGACAAA
jgi:hypothetical protein